MLKTLRTYLFAFIASAILFPAIGYGAGNKSTENIIDAIAVLGVIAFGIFIMSDPNRRRNRFFRVLIVGILVTLSGCSTVERSTLFGVSMGAAAGLGTGVLIEKSPGSALIGAGVGAILGAGLGFLLHPTRDSSKEVPASRKGRSVPENELPFLQAPEASCSRVDAHIEGGHYFGPRVECEIQKGATWSR